MEVNSSINQNVSTLFSNLEDFTQKEGVLGKSVSYGDKTFIPVISVSLGYGGGNTSNKNQQNNTSAANQGTNTGSTGMGVDALGLGARLSADAVILIDKDNVSMMTVGTASNMSQMINKLPQMFTGMNQNKQHQDQQNQQQGQQNQQ
jgi:uncharacterized spore protein YtfJ